jgi:hypothetical protein
MTFSLVRLPALAMLLTACAGNSRTLPDFRVLLGDTANQVGNAVVATSDGGALVVGYTSSNGSDAFIARLTQGGDTAWTRTIGGPGLEAAWDVLANDDGTFTVAGFAAASPDADSDMWLFTIGAGGRTLREHRYAHPGDERATGVVRGPGGSLLLVGQTAPVGGGAEDARVVLVDPAGDTLWTRTIAGPGRDRLFAGARDAKGAVLVGLISDSPSRSDSAHADRDAWVVAMDWDGNVRWTHRDRVPGHQTTHHVITRGDLAIVTAYGQSAVDGDNDMTLFAIDADGEARWTERAGGPGDDRAMMTMAWGEGLLTAGYSRQPGGDWEMWLVESTDDGRRVAERTIPNPGDDWAVMVSPAPGGDYLLTGKVGTPDRGADLIVLRRSARSLRDLPR